MVQIVEAIIDEKPQLGNDAQLVAHSCAQLVTYGLLVCHDILQQFLTLV